MRAATPHILVFVAALAAPALAHAADVVGEEPPAPSVPYEEPVASGGWSGPYAGVTLGYGLGTATSDVTGAGNLRGPNGALFGGAQGQSGQIVYGVEGDVGYDGATATMGATTVRRGVDGSLRGRLGYAVTDQILLYGTAGGAAKQTRISDASGNASGAALGWTAGAGLDVKVTDKTFLRGEYRYTDYALKTLDTGSGPQAIDTKGSRISIGLGVKF